MTSGEKPDPRASTDESLRAERERTDAELAQRAAATKELATDVLAEAREKADVALSEARDREDRKHSAGTVVTEAREREDTVLETSRRVADVNVRDEGTQRQVALAKLLAFEREYTDRQLGSERKRADQALASREDFLAMVSHDLRSLLGGIALSAELLQNIHEAENPFERVRRYADQIQRFSARMSRLVGDLVDVASIEAGKLGLSRVRTSAAHLLHDAMDAFAPAAAAAGIELRSECDNAAGDVELDHDRILQVLTNLVGNALKFTPQRGQIVLRLERRGTDVCFAVADTGVGIPSELTDKVFERYFQSRETDRRGLGLGLFISKSIIEGHGGRIWVESTPGKGSTFHFCLPALAP